MVPFKEFPKISRFYEQEICITEKIDGTNGLIHIKPAYEVGIEGLLYDDPDALFQDKYALHFKKGFAIYAGSRTRWLTPDDDNYDFAKWVKQNAEELFKLGKGSHYGEWWGQGINRKYSMSKKVFSLFNVHKWIDVSVRPECCDVVPILYTGLITPKVVHTFSKPLQVSEAAKKYGIEFDNPEGTMFYLTKAGMYLKAPNEKGHKKL